MKSSHISCIGAILLCIGFILQLWSWHLSYPIYIPRLDEITFTQFYPLIWPGIALSLIGLFLTGYYSKRKSVKVACASLFPILIYSYALYFSFISSSDSGNVKGMFEIFHQTGINSGVVSYFQYPIYFTLNEMTDQILGVGVNGIAALFFILFGLLLGAYLYLFLTKITKANPHPIAFLAIPLYFSGLFGFLNYQWVPQTIALVFVFMLLIIFNKNKFEYKIISIILFTTLVFTHAIIPVIFLVFFGIYVVKKKELRNSFILMLSIFAAVLIYYTTFYFPVIVETFTESIHGFGGEYTATVTGSLKEPLSPTLQFISNINRIRMPLIWIAVTLGCFIAFIKKKLSSEAIILGITGIFYLGIGMFYSVLGLRALQFVFVPLVIGIGLYIEKWKKLTITATIIILILSVFGPMGASYEQTQFQVYEEETACDFLATTLANNKLNRVAIGQVNWGYFMGAYKYLNGEIPRAIRSGKTEFYNIFNVSMEKNEYVLYNSNLGNEIISRGIPREEVKSITEGNILNNKIYESGKTLILTGR